MQNVSDVVFAAMGQAFFTLSLGIGAIAIFGSYIDKTKKLTSEAVTVVCLDTFVALVAGFIVIPACFAYNVDPGQGPGLISRHYLISLRICSLEIFGVLCSFCF